MKFGLKYLIALILISGKIYSQEKTVCEDLMISDSLFNLTSNGYEIGGKNHGVNPKYIEDVNELIKIEGSYLKMSVYHNCRCEDLLFETKLVTDGKLLRDSSNNGYYIVKLYFRNENTCKSRCNTQLCYDISDLRKAKIKFENCDQFIIRK
ncbi:MAG: hypothetical protein K0S32_2560 [Bacteroidetes bacterium]|jgi:hypothetical protein|nr:hypothetical protein [Bacteroidota bacterium]